MAAGGSGMQHTHAIQGTQVHVSTAVFHQVLGQVQVALLAGQVERGGTTVCLLVHRAVREDGVQRVLGGVLGGQGYSSQTSDGVHGQLHMADLLCLPPCRLRGPPSHL